MPKPSAATPIKFSDLGLPEPILAAVTAVGYETPSPIQAATIPPLLEGRDLLGQAQTGTGKTAAFALPILARLDLSQRVPQALVLAPTRELAIQVAEAFQRYAARLPDFHVLPVYGGQSYEPQLRGLRRGAQVVVGTPGRVVDHVRRGTLRLDHLRQLVLDEADEMLRMGFVEDIEWILGQLPRQRQIALFSATMPAPIRRIAQTHLRDPAEITIQAKTTTAANVRQRYWLVGGMHKLDALTRILEAEPFEAMIVFARTKLATEELANRLQARGFDAAALNGDVQQAQRERIVNRLRDGSLDIVVATDVAARGLDVERITHVVNYDVPTDTESYVHRIGRTGRAGRSGDAILFIVPRERHLLRAIERATRQPIEPMALPSAEAVNARRIERFKADLNEVLADEAQRGALLQFQAVIGQYAQERGLPLLDIAAALACMRQGSEPLLLPSEAARPPAAVPEKAASARSRPPLRSESPQMAAADMPRPERPKRERPAAAADMETFRIEVGSRHGVKPGNIVGAIANEAGLDSQYIGRIDIHDDYSLVDLPQGMPKAIFRDLQKAWVAGRQLQISRLAAPAEAGVPRARPHAAPRPGTHKPRKPRR
ncbi:DEAD/DEAH box helicase [Fontimonas sp. SYSU GA230001]|uniref:DEAD/DEAH box helicase n=1 Tax=Fontimonas sp. SYSU GA230001 TaxID=3142450 RepID=UPI0032B605E8